jgi:hypothetical protein
VVDHQRSLSLVDDTTIDVMLECDPHGHASISQRSTLFNTGYNVHGPATTWRCTLLQMGEVPGVSTSVDRIRNSHE